MPIESDGSLSGVSSQKTLSHEDEKSKPSKISNGVFYGRNVAVSPQGKTIGHQSSYTDTFLDSLPHIRTITKVHKKNPKLPSIRSSGINQLNAISNQLKIYWYDGHASVELHKDQWH